MSTSLPRTLQALFEAWTNDSWAGPLGAALPQPLLLPAANQYSWAFSHACALSTEEEGEEEGEEEEQEEACVIYYIAADQDSSFAAAFAEVNEARRARDGVPPGVASDGVLWAAFYCE